VGLNLVCHGNLRRYGNNGGEVRFGLPVPLAKITVPLMADMTTFLPVQASPPVKSISSNIGGTIRDFRLQRGMSQGDIEKRTGLLRCYLSRVENGHTVPSLETLQKIAGALDLQLAQFFAEDSIPKEVSTLNLSEEEIRFLTQVQRYSANLSESDRRLLLAMVRKFASSALT
jgi:transcriptional regulator with XRE-family HTH domain